MVGESWTRPRGPCCRETSLLLAISRKAASDTRSQVEKIRLGAGGYLSISDVDISGVCDDERKGNAWRKRSFHVFGRLSFG